MAKGPDDISRPVVVVALMALSKREFFQRLLANPTDALAGVRTELGLTDDDVAEVTRVVEAGSQEIAPQEALRLWDDWRATGRWGGGVFWPKFRAFWPK
jgi:hypothetical protein